MSNYNLDTEILADLVKFLNEISDTEYMNFEKNLDSTNSYLLAFGQDSEQNELIRAYLREREITCDADVLREFSCYV